ncbi:hypothetical protein [Streptomyces sp. enrichment culture]|uniref:hypothetical protein n=1 Tax=Streptomyces sp. enrichment culture TaxID=1795815 RepID=UPI003F558CF6
MRRLLMLLLALVAAVGMVTAAPPAAYADGPIAGGGELLCEVGGGFIVEAIEDDYDWCDKVGDALEESIKEHWKALWDSILGDIIRAGMDVAKWLLKKMLTIALLGPSLDLEATGLFGRDATLAGMLVWLGLVIATAGFMWQIGKMALTGQAKHIGTALRGWVENMLLTGVGLTFVAGLLAAGDAYTTGLVDKTFADDGSAYEQIVAVMLPTAIANPILMLGVVVAIVLIGFVQMVMIFLRQSAIPIQCLLLPVAGGGRTGGETTRQWTPRLVTSICVVIAYKPMVATILCIGFAEWGHAHTLAEWLRGLATLVLAILAPAPLVRIFAPFGDRVGEAMATGGMVGAVASVGNLIEQRRNRRGDAGGNGGGDAQPDSALDQARRLQQTMPRSYQPQGDATTDDAATAGNDAVVQAARTGAAQVPRPGQPAGTAAAGGDNALPPLPPRPPGAAGGDPAAGARTATPTGNGGRSADTGGGGLSIQVLDGINDDVQQTSREIGDGGDRL